jgi:ornithine cyclodeaminase
VRVVTAEEISRALTYPDLCAALADAFRSGIVAPPRHHHTIARESRDATLILMPAWTEAANGFLGAKIVTVFPENARHGKPSVMATYILMSGETGEPLAALDGPTLTAWRTAAASALAATYLARKDASHLAMIGAGTLAPHLIAAHAAVRPISRVTIWNRTHAAAVALAEKAAAAGLLAEATEDREQALAEADIVSVATLSPEPLVKGAWLKPGVHLDLVGAFTPKMREADDAAVARARLYVDTRAGALTEAGDIVQPLRSGLIREEAIAGDLAELCRGTARGRESDGEITLFKSVGASLEDLAAAVLVWQRL